MPSAARFAILWESSNLASAENWRETRDAAKTLDVMAQSYTVSIPTELVGVLQAIGHASVDGMIVLPSAVLFSEKQRLAEFAIENRLPTMFEQHEWQGTDGSPLRAGLTTTRQNREVNPLCSERLKVRLPSIACHQLVLVPKRRPACACL